MNAKNVPVLAPCEAPILLRRHGRTWDSVPLPGLTLADLDAKALKEFRDKDEPIGVENSRKLLDDLPNKIRDVLGIMADVHLVEEAGKELVEIRVEPYPSPISYKGEYHYRSGSTKQELKGAALEQFLLKKRGRHWDDAPEPSFTVRSCSAGALRLFKQRASESGRRAGYIESWGRGIQKIQRECREHDIEPPVYDFEMAGLLLTFRANPAHLQAALAQRDTAQETTQETAQETDRTAQEAAHSAQETVPKKDWAAQGAAQETFRTAQEIFREKILALLRIYPLITRKELASRLSLSDSGIKYHLEKMKAAGDIRRVGATKSGY